MTKAMIILDNSLEEEAEIRAGIAADPDTWEAASDTSARRIGRPAGSNKAQVTVKLDKDVLAALRASNPRGWQTRLNATLRQALGL